ncbi:ribonuclease [Rhizobium rhizosphaerae]|uniref:Ribonuclease n=1 Tax=Xaviernesmea rhizosphaerae TaxID=1672749 RepID=A0A1Q9ADE2_9HYPH|nr:type II toxin-antitoxin system VapC family toxin [Xaviernesmea rhizosphaerae]OLP52944.1 ribonuclease [Xaviernesmea rhizosphaerae]OQP87492.1 VapC toxin family PIN domain ribonuclease [Xaviernesmea rhizosphaerae]
MILVDTSIWIDFFRHDHPALRQIMDEDRLYCHPVIIGELALGSLRDRQSVLTFLTAQRQARAASHEQVLAMIERHAIFSMGIGYSDAQLLASMLLDTRLILWTGDRRLRLAAAKTGLLLHEPERNAN